MKMQLVRKSRAGRNFARIIFMLILCLSFMPVSAVPMVAAPAPASQTTPDIFDLPASTSDQGKAAASTSSQQDDHHIYLPLVMSNWVPQSISVWVPPEGGTVTLPDGRMSVSLPPGALTRQTLVTLSNADDTPPQGDLDLDFMLEIEAQDDLGQPVTQLKQPATLTFHYSPKDLVAVIPSELEARVQAADGSWQSLPTQVYTPTRTIEAQIEHFSLFGLSGEALTGRFGDDWTSVPIDGIIRMSVDNAGNLYLARTLDGRSITLYRRPPGAERETLFSYLGSTGYLNGFSVSDFSMTVEPDTGVLYLSLNPWNFPNEMASLVRVEPYQGSSGKAETSTVYQDTSTCYTMGQTHFSPADRTVWVECIHAPVLRQLDTATFEVLRGIDPPPGTMQEWIVDSDGRLYALVKSQRQIYGREQKYGYSLDMMVYDENAQAWQTTAEGFAYAGSISGPQMAADDKGNVFVLNVDWNHVDPDPVGEGTLVVSVINGPEAVARTVTHWQDTAAAGTITAGAGKLLVRTVGRSWVDDTPSALRVFSTDRRIPDAGNITTVDLLHNTISGHNSIATLVGGLSPIPAHHGLWMGEQRLPLVDIERDHLVYALPRSTDEFWHQERDALLHLGDLVKNLGPFETPELGNWKSWHKTAIGGRSCIADPEQPLDIAVGEWGLWTPGSFIPTPVSVASHEGLFETWTRSEQDPDYRYEWWFAYRFSTPGLYTFDVETESGGVETCQIRVSYEGSDLYWYSWFDVDPVVGGRFYNNGAMLEIPPGALPPITGTYGLRLDSRSDVSPPAAGGYQPDPTAYPQHKFYFDPEPAALFHDIHLRLPYDVQGGGVIPKPTFYDDGKNDDVASPYWLSGYVPAYHTVDQNAGYVYLTMEAGDYSGAQTLQGTATASPATQPITETLEYYGEKIKTRVNDIGENLWWRAGLPTGKIENDNFSILYRADQVPEYKALAALEGLVMARMRFKNMGYNVPDWVIVTLDPKLGEEGSVSGLGRLWHWNMSLAAWMAEDDLRSGAAHELFHIIQYENMSYGARTRKNSWTWWMEGSAVWAETVTFPDSNSAADYIEAGADFIHTGLYDYNGLSYDRAYACVVLITFLEEQHPGAVLEVLQKLGTLTDPASAIDSTVGNLTKFYLDFAEAFFSQKDEPYKSWDLSKAFSTLIIDEPETTLFNTYRSDYSAVGFKLVASTSPTAPVPISFSEADGSVLRVPQGLGVTMAWNPDGEALPNFFGVDPERGLPVAQAVTFTADEPFKVAYVNTDGYHLASVLLEVPTLLDVDPSTFDSRYDTIITAKGAGFGSVDGGIWVMAMLLDPTSWASNEVKALLPAYSVTEGTISVEVQHAAGINSNVMTIEAFQP